MREIYGILFIDNNDVILRIYQANKAEWRLMHYFKKSITPKQPDTPITAIEIAQTLADLLSTPYAQHIMEWKLFARGISDQMVSEVVSASGFQVELLTPAREQELLGKGMFTEFW